jgi:peptidoglycan/xylan/chitin deacetylase (PgdA/CDA1 family)
MEKYVFLFLFLLLNSFSTPVSAQQKIPILVYHSIAEYTGTGSKELYVSPGNFERQMKYLKDHGFTLLTFERWQERKKVPKPIFITFDDGYMNNLNALATFRKIAAPQFKPAGTLFVISDFIGRQNRLSAEELKMLADTGLFSIQSHTATHPDLTKITDYAHELREAKAKIERVTGKPVLALSYPYGNVNSTVVEETKRYYTFGLTTTPERFIEKGIKNELYYLPRIYVKNSTTIEEFSKIVE